MEEVKNTEATVSVEPEAKTEQAAKPADKPAKKGGFPKELVIALVVIVAIIAAVVSLTKGKTVNLNKYAKIEVNGYDTAGTATLSFDREKFIEDYSSKMKFKNGTKEEKKLAESIYGSAANAFCQLYVYNAGSFDKKTGLSNGDTVVYTWSVDEEAIKKAYGVNVKCSDMKLKVKGLESVPTFDPFAGVELIYKGIAPNGSVELKNNATTDIASQLRFEIDKTNGLSNGDIVKVKLRDDGSQNPNSYFINRYNAIPATTEKEYKVEGLGSYIQSASEIPADTMTKMQSQAQDVINAYVANNWSKEAKLDNLTYIGNYFLKPKDASRGNQSKIILVYRASASIKKDAEKEDEKIDDAFDYYIGVPYSQMILLPDGTCSLDITSARMLNASFQKQYKGGWFGQTYSFQGYEDLDTLFNKNVTTAIADFEYENNVVAK